MFVLVTLYGRWNRTLTKVQHVLFMTSGTSYIYMFSYSLTSPRSVLLLQLHSQPHSLFPDVEEVQTSFHGHEEKPDNSGVLQHGDQLGLQASDWVSGL